MALVVHIKDEHCTAESHVLSQFVRTPRHKPHNMEVIYTRSHTIPLLLAKARVVLGGHCRIAPPRFMAECRKRRLNQGSCVSTVWLVVYFL